MSTSSFPRPQQSTYVSAGNPLVPRLAGGLADRETQFDAESRSPSVSPERATRSLPVGAFKDDGDDEGDAPGPRGESWDNVRDGSISRRPRWRRPGPRWVLPFVLGVTLSLGMTLAVRAELYLDLACLVHPPRTPASMHATAVDASVDARVSLFENSLLDITPIWPTDTIAHAHGNYSLQNDVISTLAVDTPAMTPAERWFHWAQRDIFSYLRGRESEQDQDPDGTIPLPSDPQPGKKFPNPYPEIDPAQCKRDEGVQQASAKLTQIVAVVSGLLSAITTGWWASYSDRRGRRTVLAITEVGLLINDICFLTIASHPRLVVQTRLWVLIVGPAIDGALGGFSTIVAAMHAYISDVTPDGSRATAFARLVAAIMGGMALGPLLGSALINATGNLLSPFYISVSVHALWVILIRFVLPESLSSDSREVLRQRAKEAKAAAAERDAAEREWEHHGDAGDSAIPVEGESSFSRIARQNRSARRTMGFTRRIGRRAILPLRPLGIFWPHKEEDGRWNYNLLLMGVLNFVLACMMVKGNYVFYAFGWSPDQLGPYLSYMSSCRLIVLLVILPFILSKVKPYFREPAFVDEPAPATERTPLLPDGPGSGSPGASAISAPADSDGDAPPKPKRSARLDLWIVRICLLLDMAGYLMMGLNRRDSVPLFLVGSTVAALGTPSAPVANSLALNFLQHKHDVGRLFGAMAVLHAVGTNLVAPITFFSVFSATVGTYAPAIFLVAAGLVFVGQATVWLARAPRHEVEARGRGRDVRQTRAAGSA